MKMNRDWLNFLREQYPVGSRVRLREMKDPYDPVPPGTMGTLLHIDDIGTFHMKWDNGRSLGLVIGEDRFTVLPPEVKQMKLYMPLNAEILDYDEWDGGEDHENSLNGWNLIQYQDAILAALVKNRSREEAERGIMHWYGEQDSVNDKVRSVVFSCEVRDRQLWGVAECQVAGELSARELDTLKSYITGQASDGWGESFEQRGIQVEDGELYVHLWDFDGWDILTEDERFRMEDQEKDMVMRL